MTDLSDRPAPMTWRVIHADCIEAMRELDEASVDAIVTDPPYGLGFMGKAWDDLPPGDEFGKQALRVLKPGAHLLSFGGTRTYHHLACALEDAGFEIRDCLAWLYGSGFPKSLDVSKAIDRQKGKPREVQGRGEAVDRNALDYGGATGKAKNGLRGEYERDDEPRTPDAERWQGWGTALKPAFEPIVLARKPLSGTVAANVLEYGTGALNVDGARIDTEDDLNGGAYAETGGRTESPSLHAGSGMNVPGATTRREYAQPLGRWPANVLLDEESAAALDEQTGDRPAGGHPNRRGVDGERSAFGAFNGGENQAVGVQNTTGGASRFFYTAKTSRSERERGVREYLPARGPSGRRNNHPTVKPVDLMQWLCRLITPPGGLVLDPFLGSGSTGIAALREGFHFIGIEREAEYVEIARARIVGDAPLFNVEMADG